MQASSGAGPALSAQPDAPAQQSKPGRQVAFWLADSVREDFERLHADIESADPLRKVVLVQETWSRVVVAGIEALRARGVVE